jgi:uncharacterized protein YegJ (DUF2314 family)
MKLLFLALTAVFFAACKNDSSPDANRDDIISVDSDDAAMNSAMEMARKTFSSDFLAKIEMEEARNPNPIAQALAKVYFTNTGDSDEGEHMWVAKVSTNQNVSYSGILQSSPGVVTSLKMGDEVNFPLERISDWMLVQDGVAHGAFTVQYLRSRMTQIKREEHDSKYPFRFPALSDTPE